MTDPRTLVLPAENENNARILAAPITARFREAGWRLISSVWSNQMPGLMDEYLKGYWWAHAAAGGTLTLVYERDPGLPELPALRAAIAKAGGDRPDVAEAVRSFARLVQQAPLPPGRDRTLFDVYLARESFVGAYLVDGILDQPGVRQAYGALPPRVRLEVERADTETFLAKFAA